MVVYHIVIVLYMSMGSHMTQAIDINWRGYFVLVYLSVFWIDPKNQAGLLIFISDTSGLYAEKH